MRARGRALGAAVAATLLGGAALALAAIPPPGTDAADASVADAGVADAGVADPGVADPGAPPPAGPSQDAPGAPPPAGPAQDASADRDDSTVDEPPPPPLYVAELREPGRLVVGFGAGLGRFAATCSGCLAVGSLALSADLGVQLTPRVAALLELTSILHLAAVDTAGERAVAGHSQAIVAARTWLTPRVWLQAGVGLGAFHLHGQGGDRLTGPAGSVGFGHELLHRPGRGVDVAVRVGLSRLTGDDERTFMVGGSAQAEFHWH